tara:strand:+ start:677 stop:856 length:180 start_codon:yes stop_codon:yes gene_type:complete
MTNREEDMKEGALKGLHRDLADTLENDSEVSWPEVYSFLLADIAMSLQAIRHETERGFS